MTSVEPAAASKHASDETKEDRHVEDSVGDAAFDRRNYFHNYAMFAFDGGLFIGALAFVNASTLLPLIVERHGGPNWLIALMPVAMMVGFQLTPMLLAHRIDRQRRYLPLLLTTGVGQRLPYLLAGIVLIAGWGGSAGIVAAVAITPLVSGICGGISSSGFYQLLVKQIPERRRNSLFAVRVLLASLLGLGAGLVVERVLDGFPGPVGYGILHLVAFVFLMISLAMFASIRETPTPEHEISPHALSFVGNLRRVPEALRGQRDLLLYLGFRFFRTAIMVLAAFLSIHAVATVHESPAFVGRLVMAQSLGAVLGNLMAAFLGDRHGSKLPTWIGHAVFVALAFGAIFAGAPWQFVGIFGLFGFAAAAGDVGTIALGLAVCPAARRSTVLGLMALVNLAGTLLAAGLAAVLRGDGRFTPVAVASIVGVLIALALLTAIRDPRHAAVAEVLETDPQGVA